jgi:hypothetical protein
MTDESEQRARFEHLGEEEVRLRVLASTGFDVENRNLAYKWLEEKAKVARAEQRTTKIAAIVAAAAGMIAVAIGVLAWLYPRH